jgi:ADP-ribose pyrophosphatase YjhB (NUDIX family)
MTYRNPPKKYQFKKGQSGNPKGRPRKKLQTGTTLADDLRRELSEEITVKKNGETKRVTKQSALISSIATSAINGSSSQQRLVLQMLFMHGMNNDNAIDAKELQKHDEALLVELQKLGLKIDEADDDT